MTANRINPSEVARKYRASIRTQVAELNRPLHLVGFLAQEDGPSKTYADYTRIGCEDVGIKFSLRMVSRVDAEAAVQAANDDPDVHGILIYYPVFDSGQDRYLKDLVDHRKDIEGLNSFWVRKLYANERFADEDQTKKAILPCTPLAIIKLMEETGLYSEGADDNILAGKNVVIFNRSEVVGRPLARMLANDGAQVTSFDVNGPMTFHKDGLGETRITRSEALKQADVVITGVPSRSFDLIRPEEITPETIAINFSTLRNYSDEARDKAKVFVPRVGP